MKNKNIYLIAGILVVAGGLLFYSKSSQQKTEVGNFTTNETVNQEKKTSIANPASVNCEKKGGKLTIEKKPDKGEYGVCIFEDNRQCEEWALYRNQCPEGGVKITGYDTDAQRYCAITGGEVIKEDCKLSNGSSCNAQDYFEDICPASKETSGDTGKQTTIKAAFSCKDKKSVEAVFSDKDVSLTLSDGRKMTLNQALSASGARYANKDESFVFWNKGDTAFIEEIQTTTYADCLSK